MAAKPIKLVLRPLRTRRVHDLAVRLRTDEAFSKDPRASLEQLEEGLRSRIAAPQDERVIVERLIDAYHQARVDQADAAPPYQPNEVWRADIAERRAPYLSALDRRDADALAQLLRGFLRNSGVAGLRLRPYCDTIRNGTRTRQKARVLRALREIDTWSEIVGGDPAELEAPPIGDPWGYVVDGRLYMTGAARYNRYAHVVSSL